MANLVREVQTAKSLSPKGKRARFQITFIPDDDLKELKYFKRNKMTTSLISAKELMGRYIKMVDTARERDWNFAQMFIGIVIDEEEDGN
jgi:transposase